MHESEDSSTPRLSGATSSVPTLKVPGQQAAAPPDLSALQSAWNSALSWVCAPQPMDGVKPAAALNVPGVAVTEGTAVTSDDPSLLGVGSTALMMASCCGQTEIVVELLNAGASADQAGEKHWEGKTALILALEGGHAETAKALAPYSTLQQPQIEHIVTLLRIHSSAETPTEAEEEALSRDASCAPSRAGPLKLAAQLIGLL